MEVHLLWKGLFSVTLAELAQITARLGAFYYRVRNMGEASAMGEGRDASFAHSNS